MGQQAAWQQPTVSHDLTHAKKAAVIRIEADHACRHTGRYRNLTATQQEIDLMRSQPDKWPLPRDLVQRPQKRIQYLCTLLGSIEALLRRQHGRLRKGAHSSPTQLDHMRQRSKQYSKILNQNTDIRTLAAGHTEQGRHRIKLLERKAVDLHRPGSALDLPACPGYFMESLTLMLQGRIHRWDLLDRPRQSTHRQPECRLIRDQDIGR
jgi:hypothetical protein